MKNQLIQALEKLSNALTEYAEFLKRDRYTQKAKESQANHENKINQLRENIAKLKEQSKHSEKMRMINDHRRRNGMPRIELYYEDNSK